MFSISRIRQLFFLSALYVFTPAPGAAHHGLAPTHETCDERFTWDLETRATCTNSGGQKYDCKLADCTFDGQPVGLESFIFHQCSYMEGGGPPPQDVTVMWFNNNQTNQVNYPLDVYGISTGPGHRWTCPVGPGLNNQRPVCKNCRLSVN